MSKANYIILAIIFFLIGFIIGEQIIRFQELNWCVKTGTWFLHAKGINIGINDKALTMALDLYQSRIDHLLQTNFSSVGS